MPSCYVAGSTHDIDRVRVVQALAVDAGYDLTFDWTGPEGSIRPSWDGYEMEGARISEREVQAAKADVLVLVCPAVGRGLGCFVELGVALGNGSRCLILGPPGGGDLPRDSVFYRHQQCTIVHSLRALMEAL